MDLSLCKKKPHLSPITFGTCACLGFFSELDSFSQVLLLLGTLE